MSGAIRFVIEPNSSNFMVKGYVGDELVATIPANSKEDAQDKAEKWRASTKTVLEKTAKLLENETKGMGIERHAREEKIL